ncbi:hypothetical protein ATANTOWER_024639 [Ataeniobius toweri]|uniref:Uncharacterized protein n=1 Tax=Ataeniobius toweri TaxID=208326 RepID=A0ABU7B9I2_9TELE|nr:hypothetical protein [Ataeniobius toweri]
MSKQLENCTSNYTLSNPRVYLDNRRCTVPLSPTIRPSELDEATFSKKPSTAQGSIGIFTYDLLNNLTKTSSEKVAVLFVVPFDLYFKSIGCGVGIFGGRAKCNQDLFKEMFETTNTNFVRGKAKDSVFANTGVPDLLAPVSVLFPWQDPKYSSLQAPSLTKLQLADSKLQTSKQPASEPSPPSNLVCFQSWVCYLKFFVCMQTDLTSAP